MDLLPKVVAFLAQVDLPFSFFSVNGLWIVQGQSNYFLPKFSNVVKPMHGK